MTGESRHNIDAKGRLFVPAKLREELGSPFYLCKGLDGCLFGYTESGFAKLGDKINEKSHVQSRQLKRFLYSTTQKCEPDAQGRVVLSAVLRDYAGIEKEATVIGAGDHAEIWSSARWDAQNFGSLEEFFDALEL